jgi:hypothetical protein
MTADGAGTWWATESPEDFYERLHKEEADGNIRRRADELDGVSAALMARHRATRAQREKAHAKEQAR